MTPILVPLKYLWLLMDVECIIRGDSILTLISNRDMVINGLDIAIHQCHITLSDNVQTLEMCNFFRIHLWSLTDVHFDMYTERDLRTTKWLFCNPSV